MRLRDPVHQLHVPVLFDVEIANILWKKVRQGIVLRSQADQMLAQLLNLPLTRHPDEPLLTTAFDLADRARRTVYDCLYLALAIGLSGQMVTADDRLANSLKGTPWDASVVRLHDIP